MQGETSPRASQVSTPWSSRPPSRLDSRGTSRPETPWTENNDPPPPRSLVRRLVAVTTRRDNAEVRGEEGAWLAYAWAQAPNTRALHRAPYWPCPDELV
jgi:hypothetical protein